MIVYKYKCPVCKRVKTSTAAAMCSHMCWVHDRDWSHANWMKARGIDHSQVCRGGRGCRKPLSEVVERECRIRQKVTT